MQRQVRREGGKERERDKRGAAASGPFTGTRKWGLKHLRVAVRVVCPSTETVEGNCSVQQGDGVGKRTRQPGPEEGKRERGKVPGCNRSAQPEAGCGDNPCSGGDDPGAQKHLSFQRRCRGVGERDYGATANPPPAPGRAGWPA